RRTCSYSTRNLPNEILIRRVVVAPIQPYDVDQVPVPDSKIFSVRVQDFSSCCDHLLPPPLLFAMPTRISGRQDNEEAHIACARQHPVRMSKVRFIRQVKATRLGKRWLTIDIGWGFAGKAVLQQID